MRNSFNYRMDLYEGMKLFYKEYCDRIAVRVSAILANRVRFTEALTQLYEQKLIADSDNTGATDQKKLFRLELRKKLLELSGSLGAFFLIIKDDEWIKKVHLTKTMFNRKREGEIHHIYDVLLTAANDNEEAIADHGINTQLAEVTSAFTNFNSYISIPKDLRSQKAAARKKVIECDAAVLKEVTILGNIVQSLPETFHDVKIKFSIKRRITDTPRARRAPDAKSIIKAGMFLVIFTLPYMRRRYFKIRSLGDGTFLWGLSTLETGFNNKSFPLKAGKSSIRLSRAMGSEGDFLVVHNPTDKDMEVEVWKDF